MECVKRVTQISRQEFIIIMIARLFISEEFRSNCIMSFSEGCSRPCAKIELHHRWGKDCMSYYIPMIDLYMIIYKCPKHRIELGVFEYAIQPKFSVIVSYSYTQSKFRLLKESVTGYFSHNIQLLNGPYYADAEY